MSSNRMLRLCKEATLLACDAQATCCHIACAAERQERLQADYSSALHALAAALFAIAPRSCCAAMERCAQTMNFERSKSFKALPARKIYTDADDKESQLRCQLLRLSTSRKSPGRKFLTSKHISDGSSINHRSL